MTTNELTTSIKFALESVTFGKRVSGYYSIPLSIIENSKDCDLTNNVTNYLLSISGYAPHLDESFIIINK